MATRFARSAVGLCGFIGAAALVAAGVWLVIPDSPGAPPHAQPLPARTFEVEPGQARQLPKGDPLLRPQAGSIVRRCAPSGPDIPQIQIPSLCIYAQVEPERVVDDSLGIPSDVRRVGLDADSAPLGAAHGTTIVAGHVDNVDQGAGAFYFLHQAQPGAVITLAAPAGGATGGRRMVATTWRVYKVDVADRTNLPADLWAATGPRRLVLITCGGPLLKVGPGRYHYEDNVLVYATPA